MSLIGYCKWSKWSTCSKTESGECLRTQTILQEPNNPGPQCSGNSSEACSRDACCEPGIYKNTHIFCSNQSLKVYKCSDLKLFFICYYLLITEDRQDCVVSGWNVECPTCGNAIQFRSRQIEIEPMCNGTACPHLHEDCNFIKNCTPGILKHM